jgi:hypothetical protein
MSPQFSGGYGNVSVVLTGAYRELLVVVAGAAATLTGLLFVALSVTPADRAAGVPAVVRDVRAAASLSAFSNALAVSLFGLVPGTNAGYPALVTAAIGLLFTAAGLRSIIASPETTASHLRGQLGLIGLLAVAFGWELAAGVQLIVAPASQGGAQQACFVLAGLLLIGIARSWELISNRDTGIVASLAVLTGREAPWPADAGHNAGSERNGDL